MGLKIGVLGAGNVGGTLGRLWAAKGHDVVFGKRGASNREAASSAQVVVLTVPWPAAQEAIRDCGDLAVAAWASGAKVVKAFNTIGAINFGNADFGGVRADGFYCGDDAAPKSVVKGLISDAGLNPVDVGPLRNARLLEPLAMLWIDLAVNQKQGSNHGFKLLRR